MSTKNQSSHKQLSRAAPFSESFSNSTTFISSKSNLSSGNKENEADAFRRMWILQEENRKMTRLLKEQQALMKQMKSWVESDMYALCEFVVEVVPHLRLKDLSS